MKRENKMREISKLNNQKDNESSMFFLDLFTNVNFI